MPTAASIPGPQHEPDQMSGSRTRLSRAAAPRPAPPAAPRPAALARAARPIDARYLLYHHPPHLRKPTAV